ncbi:hypothetical protein [Thalassotalea sp. ND16A]|uniref:hypothetical protein n=1 Tax=Thalassotalea sp. ND16A TaxID=1535422 RepID=UPI00051DDDFC|nr:hypothetical protein [Thalassotalea sp. ND16A]KGJ98946.1 hypothetical protein ND16A_0468 [Thalassotalea sp. ND16A]
MSHNRSAYFSPTLNLAQKKQQGASLIMAVFMIVVLSLMAAALVRIIASSSETVSYQVFGTRAYAAADIGNQWGLQQLFPLGSEIVDCAVVNAATVPDLANVPGLIGCHIETLQCTDFIESGVTYFTLTATGACDAGSVRTSRTLQVEARSLQ